MSVHGIVEQYPGESYPSQPRHNAESSAEDTEFRALFTKGYFKKQSQKSTEVGVVYLTTERVPPPLEYLNIVIVLSNAILILVKSIQSRIEISSRMSRRSRVPIFVSFIKTEDIEHEYVVSGRADSQMFARLQSVCLRLMPESGSVSIFGFGSRPQKLLSMYQCPRTTCVQTSEEEDVGLSQRREVGLATLVPPTRLTPTWKDQASDVLPLR
ncbi:hypothetical protein ALC62_13829 [Cyphomyrmex costatus]|uniref:Uncharacterized protein n=1 Tax=Cyphomyrmex costatus TaxID=456900 RepID=A0A195C5E1_9HYME|nr:hypothetical protein ALC62_13829 [Cyphomyrmex costatus]